MSRDRDRRRVYGVENLIFDETLFTEPLGAAGVVDLAGLVNQDPWWVRNGVAFTVSPARRESQHSSAFLAGEVARIRLSVHQEDAATLAHELAHLLAGRHDPNAGHGPLFRAAELDTVTLVCGTTAAARLGRAFDDADLTVAARRWQDPTGAFDRGIYGRWRLRYFTTTADVADTTIR